VVPVKENLKGHYITLSYCWGSKPNFMLTSTTIVKFSSGIQIALLPKTLQDAVHITRWLNIKYLWIDSLCIIQDSGEDWEREASKMPEVYMNSYLTIAAMMSADSNGGCFSFRNPLVHQPCCLFDDPIGLFDGSGGRGIFAHPFEADQLRVGSTFEDSPLRKRAWVLQERILSPRIVYFGDTIIWECNERFVSDIMHGRAEVLMF
jgi:hypothetical protein